MSIDKKVDKLFENLANETTGVIIIFIVCVWVYQKYFWERPLEIAREYPNPTPTQIIGIWSVPAFVIVIIFECMIYFLAEIIDAYREKKKEKV